MCGIAGYISSGSANYLPGALRGMAAAIQHRGPDGEGFFETVSTNGKYHVGLAHRRLAIIDLSSGHQPMSNGDGSIQVVFNGEIYNFKSLRIELEFLGYTFSTDSDTETIVHAYEAWGTACVEKFHGMFAFALWDADKQELFLARDRFGKKPLYFIEFQDTLLFASEVKAILTFPGVKVNINACAVWDYFAYRYVPAPSTLFDGIHKLKPGSWALWKSGELMHKIYYQPPDRLKHHGMQSKSNDPVDSFFNILDSAVEKRMVSDVPFGAFLSGGLDSSAVVALMSRHSSSPVKTFSIGFSETAYSELAYAKVIADRFKTDHHELVVSADQIIEYLPRLIRFRDAPVAEPSDIPIYLLACEAAKKVKMVLTGEGADEFLGGYPKHVYESYASSYQRLPHVLRTGVIEPLVQLLPYSFRRVKTTMINFALEDPTERFPRWFGAMSDDERRGLVAMKEPTSTCSKPEATCERFEHESGNSPLRNILHFDQASWLPDNLLERGDSMTMAASLEGRMPFMDHELAEFVSSLDDHWRVRRHQTKFILREAMKRILPDNILGRPKVGLRVPVNEWFRSGMKDYLHDHLLGTDSKTRVYFHRDVLEKRLHEHSTGRQNHEKLLWCLLNLELWHRAYA